MKLYALAIAAMMIAPQAQAGQLCDEVTSLAEAVMFARQEGVPLYRMEQLAKPEYHPAEQAMIRDAVSNAYKRPVFTGQANKERAISEFRAEYAELCAMVEVE